MKSILIVAAATLALSAPAAAQKMDPNAHPSASFLKEAIQGDNAEVEMGRLAAARGGSKEVRDFGKALEQDHKKGGAEARKLAKQLKITPVSGVPDEAKEERAKLSKLKGADFDSEFANTMVEEHQKDIQKYQDQATNASDQKVKDFANAQLPVLKKHLDMAQKLAGGRTGAR